MNTIVVLLPGIAGSGLKNDDHPIAWPIEILGLTTFGKEPEAIAILEDDSLEPGEPLLWSLPLPDRIPLHFVYGKFRAYFEHAGFRSVACTVKSLDIPKDHPEKLVVGFAYDWRQDNGSGGSPEGSAGDLQRLLRAIDEAYEGTEYRIFLVGHSMGGLVSRAYLENVAYQHDAWYPNIAGLITLGTPHLGAPLAVNAITGDLSKLWTPYDKLIRDFTNNSLSPSVYQLLPPPQKQFITVGADEYSIFDVAFKNTPAWGLLKEKDLNTDNLQAAQQFFAGLDYAGGDKLPPYYCVYGLTPLPTCESFTYVAPEDEEEKGKLVEKSDMAGDAIVPKWSASFQGRKLKDLYSPPGSVNHLELPGDPDVLRQVVTWIGVTAPVIHFTEIEVPAATPA